MPPGVRDPVLPLTEPTEQQSLMGSVGGAYDALTDLKVRSVCEFMLLRNPEHTTRAFHT